MVLQMPVYDYNGRKVKVRKSEKQMDVPISETQTLPSIDNKKLVSQPLKPLKARDSFSQQRDGCSTDTQNKAVFNSSLTENEIRERSSDDDRSQILPSSDDDMKETSGVLNKGLLSRRVNGQVLYFPSLIKKTSSMLTSRSEPSSLDNFRRRYVYDSAYGHVGFDSTDRRNAQRVQRWRGEERVVTFYRNFESTTPELRLVISRYRFRDIRELIDDLSRILNLRDREKHIHAATGIILSSLDEFTNGGVYFFGPPRVYNLAVYYKFRLANASEFFDEEETSPRALAYQGTIEDHKNYGITPHIGNPRRRIIRIITNINSSQTYTLTVDTNRHQTLSRVIQELNDMIKPENGRINCLCTKKGRILHSIGDLLWTADDCFVGVVTSLPNRNASRTYPLDEKNEIADTRDVNGVQTFVNGFAHKFDPPSSLHPDYPYLRNSDLNGDIDIRLEWLYGYNGKRCRNNVFTLLSDELVYPVASAVVIYNHKEHRQRFYLEHTDEIRCISQHPGLIIFASGQCRVGRELGHIRVWDSESLLTYRVLDFEKLAISVECLSFSKVDNGVHLASIYTDHEDWMISMWDWSKGSLLCTSEPQKFEEVACAFHPEENVVVSCGASHVYRWRFFLNALEKEVGQFNNHKTPELVTCIAFTLENRLITADSEGFVHIWDEEKFTTSSIIKTSHEESIASLLVVPTGHVMTGGESDGFLTAINPSHAIPIIIQANLPQELGGVAAMALHKSMLASNDVEDLPLLIGTTQNCIVSGSMKAPFLKVVSGSAGIAKALATHPSEPAFVCAGHERRVEMWSSQTHSEVWSTYVDHACIAAAFHTSGETVVMGTTTGQCLIMNAKNSSHVSSFQCDKDPITAIQFSADSKMLAVGTSTGTVFLFLVYDHGRNVRLLETVKTLFNPIIAIDWSITSHQIRFVTSSLELGIWNIAQKSEEIRRHVIRDIVWTTHNSVLSYQTSGIWNSSEVDGNFTTGCRSNSGELFCAASNHGVVRLFAYPCDFDGASYQDASLHKCAVSHAKFLSNNRSFVTVGESDFCLAQWSIVVKHEEQDASPRAQHARETSPSNEKNAATEQSKTNKSKYLREPVENGANILPKGRGRFRHATEPERLSIPSSLRTSKRDSPFARDLQERKGMAMNKQEMEQTKTSDDDVNNRSYEVVNRKVDKKKKLARRYLSASLPDL